jgi:hypothetical protein
MRKFMLFSPFPIINSPLFPFRRQTLLLRSPGGSHKGRKKTNRKWVAADILGKTTRGRFDDAEERILNVSAFLIEFTA